MLIGTCITHSKCGVHFMQLPVIIPEVPNLNTTAFSVAPYRAWTLCALSTRLSRTGQAQALAV